MDELLPRASSLTQLLSKVRSAESLMSRVEHLLKHLDEQLHVQITTDIAAKLSALKDALGVMNEDSSDPCASLELLEQSKAILEGAAGPLLAAHDLQHELLELLSTVSAHLRGRYAELVSVDDYPTIKTTVAKTQECCCSFFRVILLFLLLMMMTTHIF